jgi:hypothetical protein
MIDEVSNLQHPWQARDADEQALQKQPASHEVGADGTACMR